MAILASRAVLCIVLLPAFGILDGADQPPLVVEDNGIRFVSSTPVSKAAIERARYVVQVMTSNAPKIRQAMVAKRFQVEIIGKNQVLSDLPDYARLKGKTTRDGRQLRHRNQGTQAETSDVPVERENLLCLPGSEVPARTTFWCTSFLSA